MVVKPKKKEPSADDHLKASDGLKADFSLRIHVVGFKFCKELLNPSDALR